MWLAEVPKETGATRRQGILMVAHGRLSFVLALNVPQVGVFTQTVMWQTQLATAVRGFLFRWLLIVADCRYRLELSRLLEKTENAVI
jgi:hypothetical protein